MKSIVGNIPHRRHAFVRHFETLDHVGNRLVVEFCQLSVVRRARQPIDHQPQSPPLTIDLVLLKFTIGFVLKINLLSLLGMFLGIYLYKNV